MRIALYLVPKAINTSFVSLFLVVNGLEKGNMWTDQRAYDFGIYPTNEEEFGSATRISFLDWYEKWLDHSIDEINGQP
jgi:hypothetical protein